QGEENRSKEIGKRRLHLAQTFHVRDVAGAFHAEEKIRRCFREPALIAGRRLQRVKRTVDLDRVENTAGIFQLSSLSQFPGIKLPAPSLVAPPGNTDARSGQAPLLARATAGHS